MANLRQADIATRHARTTDDALVEGLRHEKAALHGARRGLIIGLIVAGVFFAAAVCLVLVFRAPKGNAAACMREHAGFVDIKPSCTEPVSIERDGDVIVGHPGVSLEERRNGWRVRHGIASFVARPRDGADALRVFVSHGVIVVTGTRFTVTQAEGKGQVKVDEGAVVFHDDDGTDVELRAGGELAWPRPAPAPLVTLDAIPLAPPKQTPLARGGAPRAAAAKAAATPDEEEDEEEEEAAPEEELQPTGVMSMEDILKRISTLRRQRRQREAVELLVSQSQRGDITPAQMARLSWEIGLFMQDSGERAATCNHWKNHARKYPDDVAHLERVRAHIKDCESAQ